MSIHRRWTPQSSFILPYRKENKNRLWQSGEHYISPLPLSLSIFPFSFLQFSILFFTSFFLSKKTLPPSIHKPLSFSLGRFLFFFLEMCSIMQTFQKTRPLPVSQSESKEQLPGLRRRLSSLSLNMQPISSSPATSWAFHFHRSKSLSSMGEYAGSSIRKWWDWGWSWVLSRKPTFAQDLEMNEEETMVLGCHNKGSWRHVFYKVKSEIKKLVGSDDKVGLPQTYRYDSLKKTQEFWWWEQKQNLWMILECCVINGGGVSKKALNGGN